MLENKIEIFQLNLDTTLEGWEYLNDEEKAYSIQLQIEQVKKRFIASRGYLRKLLSHYLDQKPHRIELLTAPHGKKFIQHFPLHFNLAHSHEQAIYAFSNQPLGIDIEKHRDGIEIFDIGKRVLTANELEHLKISKHPKTLFFELWARKEALIKATGEGFNALITDIETMDRSGCFLEKILYQGYWFIKPLDIIEGFSSTLAFEKECDIEIFPA